MVDLGMLTTAILTWGANLLMVVGGAWLLFNAIRFYVREVVASWRETWMERTELAQDWRELMQEIRAKWAEYTSRR
jgi:hypothetical protein